MNEYVGNVWRKYKLFTLAILLVAGSLLGVQFLVQEKLENLQAIITEQVTNQQERVIFAAKVTAGSEVDKSIEKIVMDWSVNDRSEFDTLLSQLDTSYASIDLLRLDNLFGRCGGFFAKQKAVTTAKLEREVEIFAALIEQLEVVTNTKTVESYRLSEWQALAQEEQKQSDLFSQLVTKQEVIIKALLEGKKPESEELKKIMQETQQVQQTLLVASKQTTEIRSQLIKP